MKKKLMTIKEVCDELGVGRTWLYNAEKNGEYPSGIRISNRAVRYSREKHEEYLRNKFSENKTTSCHDSIGNELHRMFSRTNTGSALMPHIRDLRENVINESSAYLSDLNISDSKIFYKAAIFHLLGFDMYEASKDCSLSLLIDDLLVNVRSKVSHDSAIEIYNLISKNGGDGVEEDDIYSIISEKFN